MARLQAANDNGAYVDCLIRFQGQFFDAETGLHYNRHRYYDPYAGEYLSPDPIGLAGGLRSYGYVTDPTAWIDPLGLAGCDARYQRYKDLRAQGMTAKEASYLSKSSNTAGVNYGKIDSNGRRSGITATINQSMIGTGSHAAQRIRPPGFKGGSAGHARGHLFGRQLGGAGNVPENLVTLMQNPTNTPQMSRIEGNVRSAVEAGEVVDYVVTPVYNGTSSAPSGVRIVGQGSGGFTLNEYIPNPL